MNFLESVFWIAIGFVPTLLAMEAAWRITGAGKAGMLAGRTV